jgi:hypothetical protein
LQHRILALRFLQLNEALGDTPFEGIEYSIRMEQDQALRIAERVAAAMAKWVSV